MLKSFISNIVAKHFKKKLEKWTIKEEDVNELLKEIRISLLDADVNLLVVKKFINEIRSKVVGVTIMPNEDPQKTVLLIIKNELIDILGKKTHFIATDKNQIRIMLVGLQGSGKTTTCGKLAYFLKNKHNKKPLLVANDIYRPAAIEQLRTIASQNNFDFYEHGLQDPVKTCDESLAYAKENNDNVIIFDTAGRLETNKELMDELVRIRNKINPNEIILVVDSMSGQNIFDVANEFHKTLNLTGIILTKMDNDSRAGAALSLTNLLDVPIMFSGDGEKMGNLDVFHPERIADRILGLGDIMTLAEKVSSEINEKQAKTSMTKMFSGKMDLDDLMNQLEQMSKVGSLGSIVKMLPGLANKVNDDQIDEAEKKIRIYKIILSSMTKNERRNPYLFKKEPNRKNRVIKGSGRKPDEFNKLFKEWEQGKEKMEQFGKMLKAGKNPFGGLM